MALARLFATGVRRWLAVILLGLIGLLGGAGYALSATPKYQASSTLFLSVSRGSSVSTLAEGNTYTQDMAPSFAMIATMPIILDPVIQQLGLHSTAEALSHQVTVTLPPGGVILKIEVTDSSAKTAAAVADAIAAQLISTVPTLSGQGTNAARLTLSRLSSAVVPSSPSSPKLSVDLVAGLLAGLVVAVGLIVISELIASAPVRNRQAASDAGGAPVLGMIVEDRKARQRPLPVSTHPYLPRAEGFRILLTSLQLMRRSKDPISIVLTAATRGEGSTSTAANLAVALCHTDQRVLLVDANLRDPQLAEVLGVRGDAGLSSVLGGTAAWQDVVQTWETQIWGDRRLSVLPAGPIPANAGELLDSPAMRALMADLRRSFDVILLDCPPLLASADGALLAARADGALLVIDARRTRRRHVGEAAARLRTARASLLGLVLNRVGETGRGAGERQTQPGRLPNQRLHSSSH